MNTFEVKMDLNVFTLFNFPPLIHTIKIRVNAYNLYCCRLQLHIGISETLNQVSLKVYFSTKLMKGRAIAQEDSRRVRPRRPGFEDRSGHVGFVVDKMALEQVSSEYFCFSCQFSFRRLLHTHHLSSGTGTIGQRPTYRVHSVSSFHKNLMESKNSLGKRHNFRRRLRFQAPSMYIFSLERGTICYTHREEIE
jgi:hypothetical protein